MVYSIVMRRNNELLLFERKKKKRGESFVRKNWKGFWTFKYGDDDDDVASVC